MKRESVNQIVDRFQIASQLKSIFLLDSNRLRINRNPEGARGKAGLVQLPLALLFSIEDTGKLPKVAKC